MNATIVIELPPNRDLPGIARLVDEHGQTLAGPFPAYGRADSRKAELAGNITRSPLLKYGDTPYGTYRVPTTIPTGPGTRNSSLRSYGSNGALVLDPQSGDALLAKENGRSGLLIHGGDPGANGALRATWGCVRLSNNDIKTLLATLDGLSLNQDSFSCEIVNVDVVIDKPVEKTTDDDGQDPPAGVGESIANAPARWVNRSGATHLVAHLIPNNDLARLHQIALDEASRRNRLADWTHSLGGELSPVIAAAEYWWNVYHQNVTAIADENSRARMAALSDRMDRLQARANEVLLRYDSVLREIAENQASQAVLTTISTILGLAQSALSIGAMLSNADQPVTATGSAAAPTTLRFRSSVERGVELGRAYERFSVDVDGAFQDMEQLNGILKRQWSELGFTFGEPPALPTRRPL